MGQIIREIETDDDGVDILKCDNIEWRGTTARTPDGYVATIGFVLDLAIAVIRIQPPWHKLFYASAMKGEDLAPITERAINRHRRAVGSIKTATSHGNAFSH
jgi:hypothetical protein